MILALPFFTPSDLVRGVTNFDLHSKIGRSVGYQYSSRQDGLKL